MNGKELTILFVSLHTKSKTVMANDYFRFKKFTIWQLRCAMKVGTDGTLLGAWADGGERILDIGTGTGLIALMMAQRFQYAKVRGVDIDADAVEQAKENVAGSPFANRVAINHCDVAKAEGCYDCIVSNPPYFADALTCPDDKRSMARHADTLTYEELMSNGWRLLSEEGIFSLIIPFDCKARLESVAVLQGFFKIRECAVRTTPAKSPRRFMLTFAKHPSTLQQEELIIGSENYQELTKDFYL